MLVRNERIKLTDGNIRNNYIRLHQFNGLIPADTINAGDDIVLDLDGVGQIKTGINKEKGILSERRAIRRFFQLHALKADDEIGVEKIDDTRFRVCARHKNKASESTKSDQRRGEPEPSDGQKTQLALFEPESRREGRRRVSSRQSGRRANDLSGKDWTSYSISVWRDIRKSKDEKHLEHPAMFPIMLVERVIRCFTASSEKVILDPFMGSGSTLIGACLLGRKGIGFEVYPEYVELARQRLASYNINKGPESSYVVHAHDARKLGDFVAPDTVDLCFTSPPYWNILSQRRSADYKEIRDYGDSRVDLSCINDYSDFVNALAGVFFEVYKVLKPGKYCVVNVMDLRKGKYFYPFHADLARALEKVGYIVDDIIIWDRSQQYNNLRPLGYPAVFRINKVHEYLVIFQKPKAKEGSKRGAKEA